MRRMPHSRHVPRHSSSVSHWRPARARSRRAPRRAHADRRMAASLPGRVACARQLVPAGVARRRVGSRTRPARPSLNATLAKANALSTADRQPQPAVRRPEDPAPAGAGRGEDRHGRRGPGRAAPRPGPGLHRRHRRRGLHDRRHEPVHAAARDFLAAEPAQPGIDHDPARAARTAPRSAWSRLPRTPRMRAQAAAAQEQAACQDARGDDGGARSARSRRRRTSSTARRSSRRRRSTRRPASTPTSTRRAAPSACRRSGAR